MNTKKTMFGELRLQHQEEAAYLWSLDRYSNGDIAKILHQSPATVTELLQEAQARGLIREVRQRVFNRQELASLETWQRLQLLPGRDAVLNALRAKSEAAPSCLKNLWVVPGITGANSRHGFGVRIEQFGIEAAPLMSRLIHQANKSRHVAIAWGATLRAIVSQLERLQLHHPPSKPPIRFIPTCGEPLWTENHTCSASYLAAELGRIVNHSSDYALSLAGVPAIIPRLFDNAARELGVIQRFIETSPGFQRIFGRIERPTSTVGQESSLIRRVDAVFTSVGIRAEPWRMGEELSKQAGMEQRELKKAVVGDIGGVLLPKAKITSAQDSFLTACSRLWTGINRSDLRDIADNARASKCPGVTVFALGANKVEPLLRAIELNIVNTVVCDSTLESALRRWLNHNRPIRRRSGSR